MRPARGWAIVVAGVLAVVVAAADGGAEDTAGAGETSSSATCTPPPFPTGGNGFDPAAFTADPTSVDHRFFPLDPGTQYVYRGSIVEEGERVRHRVVFTVTDLTKDIACVPTVVVWDRDFSEGNLIESELIFFAQDGEGNVWHFGQYPEAFDEGQFDGAAPFLVGYLRGAKAGTIMPATPLVGGGSYSEGYAPPPYFWDDRARVVARGRQTCVPAGCFDHVLVVEEFEPNKPGAYQLKFYAPGVGSVRVGWRGRNEREREVLVLVEVRDLGGDAMERVRRRALAMEARANVYGLTPPADPPAG